MVDHRVPGLATYIEIDSSRAVSIYSHGISTPLSTILTDTLFRGASSGPILFEVPSCFSAWLTLVIFRFHHAATKLCSSLQCVSCISLVLLLPLISHQRNKHSFPPSRSFFHPRSSCRRLSTRCLAAFRPTNSRGISGDLVSAGSLGSHDVKSTFLIHPSPSHNISGSVRGFTGLVGDGAIICFPFVSCNVVSPCTGEWGKREHLEG